MAKKVITTIVPIILAVTMLLGVIYILTRISMKDSKRLELAAMENYLKDRTIEVNRSSELLRLLRNDMQRLSLNQTLLTYFTNVDLGMSEKYGLGYSKYQIKELFQQYLDYQIIDNEFFYRQILLVDNDGNTIISKSKSEILIENSTNPHIKQLLKSNYAKGEIVGLIDDQTYSIMYIQPIIHRGESRGKLITVINNYIYFPLNHMHESKQLTILTIPGFEEQLYNAGISIAFNIDSLPSYYDLIRGTYYKLNVQDIYKIPRTIILSRMKIPDTSLEIINIKPFEQVFMKPDHKAYTWTVVILSVMLLIVLLVLERTHLKNHSLQVKIDAKAEQNSRIWHKNKELNFEIEKRKLIEEELHESRIKAEFLAKEAQQANRTKSLFLANMSHDIRTPMNSIIGFTDILLEKIKDKQNSEFLGHIKRSADYLLNIINDVLDISKIESGSMEAIISGVSTHEFFDDLNGIFTPECNSKNIQFEINIADNTPQFIATDHQKLKQVLVNLLNNAVKFTDKGHVKCHVSFEEEMLSIIVEDTGLGIPKAFFPYMFEPFKQVKGQNHNKYGGTGLGLAISKRIIDLMGGEIAYRSKVGEGTTFELFLPVQITSNINQEENSTLSSTKTIANKFNILIAEDNYVNQRLIGFLIKSLNHRFDIVDNGEKVLEKLHSNEKYDLLLLDIQMPIMNGYEALELIRKDSRFNDLFIIALTAQAMSGDKERILEKGANDYVSKPIDKKKLIESINKYASHRAKTDKKHT